MAGQQGGSQHPSLFGNSDRALRGISGRQIGGSMETSLDANFRFRQ
jgi:hypothetical protein